MKQSTQELLAAAGLPAAYVADLAARTLAEDLGGPGGVDITAAATIPERQTGTADLVARADGIVAGLPVAAAVFDIASKGALEFTAAVADGTAVSRDDVLATVTGPLRALLTAERNALNLLCRMSGVATHTRRWADELADTGTTVLDTRKTTPGLRILEKYAVRCGGGTNKRMGLHDVAMIKDNHKLAAGSVTAAFDAVRRAYPEIPIQVEVETLAEAVEAVGAGATFLLCDNMTPKQLWEVVAAVGSQAELEATGGLTLDRAREFAETGVDYLSVGALTHSSPILDIALDLRAG
jgi:nicotinate-nucleotide pyrophosphorylase (carboxylating)